MTPNQVKEFFERLEGPEGSNFRKEKGTGEFLFDCAGGDNKDKSIDLLLKMKLSVHEIVYFLIACNSNGGHCDCEILFNAEGHIMSELYEEMMALVTLFRATLPYFRQDDMHIKWKPSELVRMEDASG